jgi:glycosyltransferase involved in cell wall biosynthesis
VEDVIKAVEVGPPGRDSSRGGRHAAIVECDIADGLVPVLAHADDGSRFDAASILVRIFTEPIALLLVPLGEAGLSVGELAAEIEAACGEVVRRRIEDAGIRWPGTVPTSGLEPARQPPYLASRDAALERAPEVTVAICTRNRSDLCRRMLDSLVAQGHRPAHVLIVDNAPTNDTVATLAQEYTDRLSLSYVVEPRPGLAWARNCAIANSDTEVIAWVDDDEVCDRWWLAELSRGFVEHPEADAVSGSILPAELETASQWIFEAYGGHRMQRGFEETVFSPATRHLQSPLYPLPAFGAGGNMAFRREAIERIGRFDPALGAGTLSMGAEDTAALCLLLYEGGTVVFRPPAFVYHYHHREYDALERVFVGYGRGLTAFYTSVLIRHPIAVAHLARLSGRALYDLFSKKGARLQKVEDDFPRELIRANLRGMVEGPIMYGRARLRARRLRRTVHES